MSPLATITANHARRARPDSPYSKQRLRLASAAPTRPARNAINPAGNEHSNQARIFTPLIDAKAASRMLGVPHTWLLAQAREGRIPHHRLGHYVRFNPEDLREWLKETRSMPGANGFHRR
jgi:excisionase family DNA binding protein